jgi:hypothetical protein
LIRLPVFDFILSCTDIRAKGDVMLAIESEFLAIRGVGKNELQ